LIVITVARKPLEGSVAKNVLKHGTGALNIDRSRVGTENPTSLNRPPRNIQGVYAQDSWTQAPENHQPTQGHSGGRFPANLILEHLPECQCEGTRKVKGITGGRTSGDNAFGQDTGWNSHENRPTKIHRPGNPDGTETIPAWHCAPGCPVADLDAQSGTLTSGTGAVKRQSSADVEGNRGSAYGAESRPAGTPMVSYGDKGGASRFFKQVGGK